MASKPRVFIGSSVGGIPIATAIHENLKHHAEVTPWNQGAFELSKTTIESLTHALDTSDYGVFVFSRDDVVNLKGKRYSAIRDNVLFELGLFIGRLGRERTFIVAPDDADAAKEIKLRIPTDLVGITLGTFESSRTDGNLVAATGSFSTSVKAAISKLGRIHPEESSENTVDNKINSTSPKEPEKHQMLSGSETDWTTLLLEKKYPEALVIIEKLLQEEQDTESITNLKIGKATCAIVLNPAQGYKDLEALYQTHKNDIDAVLQIIDIYISKSYYQKTLFITDEALLQNPDDYRLTIFKARALNGLGKTQDAISLLEADSDKIKIVLSLAALLESDDNYERAFTIIHQAYIKYPDSDEIMIKFAELAGSDKRPEERDDELVLFIADKLVSKYPDNAEYHMHVGFACLGLGLYDLALQHYRKAEVVLNDQWVYSNIGSLYKIVGLYEEAKIYFHKALDEKANSILAFSHTKMSELLNSQEEDRKKYIQYRKSGRRKASAEPSHAELLPPLQLDSSDK